MIDVVEEVEMLPPAAGIDGSFIHLGRIAGELPIAVNDDLLSAELGRIEVGAGTSGEYAVTLVIDDGLGEAAFQARYVEPCILIVRSKDAGPFPVSAREFPCEGKGRAFFQLEKKGCRRALFRLDIDDETSIFPFWDGDGIVTAFFCSEHGFLRCAIEIFGKRAAFSDMGHVGEGEAAFPFRRFKGKRRIIRMQIPIGEKRQTVDSDFFHDALLNQSRLRIQDR
mgnify:CR=1 FL=1